MAYLNQKSSKKRFLNCEGIINKQLDNQTPGLY